MALLPILNFPDPRLRLKARPVQQVDDHIRGLIADMFETMYAAPGIGLAATQVDQQLALVVMDLSEDKSAPRVFINPVVTPLTCELGEYEEGCLSVPSVYDRVARPLWVRIEALDADGQPFVEEADGLLAVCIQHELDHLEGKLFVDYLSPLKRQRAKDKVAKHLKRADNEARQPAARTA